MSQDIINKSTIEIFTSEQGAEINVTLDHETVWLTQSQLSILLETSRDNVGLHLKNIYSDGELEESTTTEDYSVVFLVTRLQPSKSLSYG